MGIRELLARLEDGGRHVRPGEWTARCPAHDDRNPSLGIRVKSRDKILVHCRAGCAPEAVVAAIGLTMADLMPPREQVVRRTIAERYPYRAADGALLFEVVRFTPKDFRQRRKAPDGSWTWNVNGVSRVLYRLPELLRADPAEPVFVVEGEKDVHAVEALGLAATTNPGGAGKWAGEYAEVLRGRWVAVIPDNDDAGRKHAAQVRESLTGVARKVDILELPRLPEKGDVSDWIAAGGSAKRLLQLATLAPDPGKTPPAEVRKARVWTFAELVRAPEVKLPPGIMDGKRLRPGTMAMTIGEGGIGKSRLMLTMARAAAAGERFGPFEMRKVRVAYLSEELSEPELAVILREMFDSAELDGLAASALLRCRCGFRADSAEEISRRVRAALEEMARPELVFIDSLADLHSFRENSNEEMGGLLRAFRDSVATPLCCCIVVLHHAGKPSEWISGVNLGRGASTLRDVVTDVFTIEWARKNAVSGPRVLKLPKGRFAGPRAAVEFDFTEHPETHLVTVEFSTPDQETAAAEQRAERDRKTRALAEKLLGILPPAPDKTRGKKGLAREVKRDIRSIDPALELLRSEGKADRPEHGPGKPELWYRITPASTT